MSGFSKSGQSSSSQHPNQRCPQNTTSPSSFEPSYVHAINQCACTLCPRAFPDHRAPPAYEPEPVSSWAPPAAMPGYWWVSQNNLVHKPEPIRLAPPSTAEPSSYGFFSGKNHWTPPATVEVPNYGFSGNHIVHRPKPIRLGPPAFEPRLMSRAGPSAAKVPSYERLAGNKRQKVLKVIPSAELTLATASAPDILMELDESNDTDLDTYIRL